MHLVKTIHFHNCDKSNREGKEKEKEERNEGRKGEVQIQISKEKCQLQTKKYKIISFF